MTNRSVLSPSSLASTSRSTRMAATACATRRVREPALGLPTTTAMLIRSCLSFGPSLQAAATVTLSVARPVVGVVSACGTAWSRHADSFEEVRGCADGVELGRHGVAHGGLSPGPDLVLGLEGIGVGVEEIGLGRRDVPGPEGQWVPGRKGLADDGHFGPGHPVERGPTVGSWQADLG